MVLGKWLPGYAAPVVKLRQLLPRKPTHPPGFHSSDRAVYRRRQPSGSGLIFLQVRSWVFQSAPDRATKAMAHTSASEHYQPHRDSGSVFWPTFGFGYPTPRQRVVLRDPGRSAYRRSEMGRPSEPGRLGKIHTYLSKDVASPDSKKGS